MLLATVIMSQQFRHWNLVRRAVAARRWNLAHLLDYKGKW